MASFIIQIQRPTRRGVLSSAPADFSNRSAALIAVVEQGFADPPPPPSAPPPVPPPVFPGILEALLELDNTRAARRPRAVAEQIFGIREPVLDNNGNPVTAGSVDVFAPGTTTRVQSFSDSALTQVNPNPVPLSGSGRANIWVGRPVDIRVNDSDGNLVANEFGLNPSNVVSGFNSGLVPNGSFELDTDSNNVPDGWTNDVNSTGSNNGLESGAGNTFGGASSWRTTSTGNGGGELVTAAAFDVNDFDPLRVEFVLRSTVAGVQNIVRVEWYDVTDTIISSTDVYDSTANPATFTKFNFLATPPAGARLARLRLIGGGVGGIIAGTTYWDNVRAFYPDALIGVFDNLTIQNNEIISTNTNGAINITPNGTGVLTLGGGRVDVSAPDLNVAGTLDVVGNTTVGGTLGVTGAFTANTVGSVTAMTAGTTLDVIGNQTTGGTLSVTGDTTLQSSLIVQGPLITATSADISAQSITTTAQSTIAGLAVSGNQTVTGTLTASGTVAVNALADIQEAEVGPAVINPDGIALTVLSNSSNPMLALNRTVLNDPSAIQFSRQAAVENRLTITNTPNVYTRTGASGAGNRFEVVGGNAGATIFGEMRFRGMDLDLDEGDLLTRGNRSVTIGDEYGVHFGAHLDYTRTFLNYVGFEAIHTFTAGQVLANNTLVLSITATAKDGTFPTWPFMGGVPRRVGVLVHELFTNPLSMQLVVETPTFSLLGNTISVKLVNPTAGNLPAANDTLTIRGTLVFFRD